MTDMERAILNLTLSLAEKMYAQADLQFTMARAVAELSGVSAEIKQQVRDAASRAESGHDQSLALLQSVKALLKKQ